MFSILIPCLKRDYLHSQLLWLSQQTFKDFTVVVMDGYYKEHLTQPFMKKSYPFPLIHVPLVENRLMAKRYDLSIRNNLALLSPTNHFVFISDTTYTPPEFAKSVADFIMRNEKAIGVFETWDLESYVTETSTFMLQKIPTKQTPSMYPLVFNRRDFFYILNGFDEVFSYACKNDFLFVIRAMKVAPLEPLKPALHRIVAPRTKFKWYLEPCERCSIMFEEKAINSAKDYDSYFNNLRLDVDPEIAKQMTYFDQMLGVLLFQCGVCGFGGPVCSNDYKEYCQRNVQAPTSALDGRAGRDLSKVYELMTSKCDNNADAKLSFLRNSY
jgi:hypothetical protein